MIMTPQQLWFGYDRKKNPLSESCLKEIVLDDKTVVRYFYFNGESCENGCTRIYAKLFLPANCKGEKAVIVMDDISEGVDSFNPAEFISRGWACLVVDYAGINPTFSRYTIYPPKLSYANYFENPSCLSDLPEFSTNSCRYVWATVALRSITFLESLNFTEIAFLGKGEGGTQAYKLAYLNDTVKAAAIMFSDFNVTMPQNQPSLDNNYIAYKAALDNTSYAPYIKIPFFMQITSNEQNSSLDRLNDIYESARDKGALLAISPRTDRTVVINQRKNIGLFFATAFSGIPFVVPPDINAKSSDKSLYFEITTDSKYEIESVTLFVARGNVVSAYRNWQAHNIEKISGDSYLAKVKVFSAEEPVFAFALVKYNYGFCISSAVKKVNPKVMGIEQSPFTRKRIIYDADMGTSNWMMLAGAAAADGELSMVSGPFDISGVSSSSNRLSTFMFADSQYKGAADSILQLNVYTFNEQILTLGAVTPNSKAKYVCQKSVLPSDEWTKLSLKLTDFRSNAGYLPSWEEVVTLEISGSGKFLINSMLWV